MELNYFIQNLKYLPFRNERASAFLSNNCLERRKWEISNHKANGSNGSPWNVLRRSRAIKESIVFLKSARKFDQFDEIHTATRLLPVHARRSGTVRLVWSSSCRQRDQPRWPIRENWVFMKKKKKEKKQRKILRKLGEGEKRMNYGFPTYKLSLFAIVRIKKIVYHHKIIIISRNTSQWTS